MELGALVAPAAGENAGFAPHHNVAGVRERGPDQVDDRVVLHPGAHRLRASPRLAGAASGEDEPDDPVAVRRSLVGAGPERPVVKQLRAFARRHLLHQTHARVECEVQKIRGAFDPAARIGTSGRTPGAPRPAGSPRFARHSAGCSGWRRSTISLTFFKSRARSSSPYCSGIRFAFVNP